MNSPTALLLIIFIFIIIIVNRNLISVTLAFLLVLSSFRSITTNFLTITSRNETSNCRTTRCSSIESSHWIDFDPTIDSFERFSLTSLDLLQFRREVRRFCIERCLNGTFDTEVLEKKENNNNTKSVFRGVQ